MPPLPSIFKYNLFEIAMKYFSTRPVKGTTDSYHAKFKASKKNIFKMSFAAESYNNF